MTARQSLANVTSVWVKLIIAGGTFECPDIMARDNVPYMPRFRKCPPARNGILVGAEAIAETFGVDRRTISRWVEKEGFPVATLPTGHVCTSLGLVDLWLLGRLKKLPAGGRGP